MYKISLRIILCFYTMLCFVACAVGGSEYIPEQDLSADHQLSVGLTKSQDDAVSDGESQINTIDLLLFNSNNGEKESSYSSADSGDTNKLGLTTTKGKKNLFAIVNYPGGDLANCEDQQQLQSITIDLTSQRQDDLTMVGEKTVNVMSGFNETSINVSRLVGKIVLKSVKVEKPYDNGHIKIKRAFMKHVNTKSKLRGSSYSPEVVNPFWQGYSSDQPNYLACLTEDLKVTGNDKGELCHFYVFENTRTLNPTVLFIEAEYKQKQGNDIKLVYYPIVIKTGQRNAVLRNNVYTLSATIKRPGTTTPDIAGDTGDLDVNAEVEDWENAEEKEFEFE